MSYKCKYVYVQGLRFRPEDVTVFWEQSDGTRRPYGLAIGYMKLGPNNELLTLLPSETKAAVKRGETMEAHVRLSNGETVVLRLDPWKLGGRKGRRSFDAGSLAGFSLRARRALALEQLKTAPYGSKNRHEAVERMLWSIDVLNDADIESMLLHASPLTKPYEGRSSSPVELAALLASDKRIIRAMLAKTTTGPGRSTELLWEMAAQATAELVYTGTSLDDMCADIAWNDEDPAVRVAAVRHMNSQSTLAKIALSDQDWPIRLAATERLAARVVDVSEEEDGEAQDGDSRPAESGRDLFEHLATTDSNAFIRRVAVANVTGYATLQSVAESDEDSSVRERAIARLFVTHCDAAQQFIARRAAEDPSRSVREAAAASVEDYSVLVGVLDRARVAAVGAEFSTQQVVDELLSRVARGPVAAGVLSSLSRRWHTPDIYKSLRGETINEWEYPADSETLYNIVYGRPGFPGGRGEEALQPKGPAIELAKVRDAEVCRRLLAELAAKSEASSQYDLTVAVHAVEALKDNPALPNELYAVATDLSARLRAAEREAHFRERDARAALRKDAEMQKLKAALTDVTAPTVEVVLRHLRRGDIQAAQRTLDATGRMGTSYKASLHAAAASLADPGQIRELVELVLPRLHDRSLSTGYPQSGAVGYSDVDLAWKFMEYVCANPATPSDVLEMQIARSWDLEDHLWRDLLEHPNATPEQRARVAELRAAAAAARERDLPR